MYARLALLASGIFFILSWLVPNHYAPWATAYNDFSAFLALLLLGAFIFLQRIEIRVSRGAVFFLLCALIPLLQSAAGLIYFSGDALLACFYLLGFAGALVLGCSVSASALKPQACGFLASIILVGAVLSVWLALNQWLLLSGSIWVADLMPGGRPFANLAQPNNLATLLCLGLAAVLYLFETRRLGAWASTVLAVFVLVGIVLTQSRTPWVGAICALLWWVWKSRALDFRLPPLAMAAWAVFYGLLLVGFPYFYETLHLSTAEYIDRTQSITGRWALWKQLWLAVSQEPWWGYGWNQVSVAQLGVVLEYPAPMMAEHGHNLILDLLLWNGPLLGGGIAVLVGVWLIRLGFFARSLESVFALLAVGLVLIHGLLEFPLDYAFFLLPVGLLLGVVEGEQLGRVPLILPRWIFAGALLVATGMLAWLWGEYRVIEEDHRLMRFENARIGNLKAEQVAPDVLLLTQLREYIRFTRTELHEGMSSSELETMRKVAHRYSYSTSLFRYALALGINGQSAAAVEQLVILRALHGDKRYTESWGDLQGLQVQYPQLAAMKKP